ncbi:MAG: hypothetical protein KDD51_12015 [Bdellovibrionales bacterium]|nr:hypothetical protein [Bdellovibrionales bacterium]
MLKWNRWIFAALGTALLSACSTNVNGPIQVRLIQPAVGHCRYNIGPATIQTLSSLSNMQGLMGRVGYYDRSQTFVKADLQFGQVGGTFTPMDYGSLYAASLYYYLESGYLLFKNLPTSAVDMAQEVPSLSSSQIQMEAYDVNSDDEEVKDNAAYLYDEGNNIFISYPAGDFINGLPFGMNRGIMIHEYTHFVMRHLVRNKLGKQTKQIAYDTLGALDEGIADYFGFLSTIIPGTPEGEKGDPAYFLCTEDSLDRDLSVAKTVNVSRTSECRNDLADYDCLRIPGSKYFSVHSLGAVFAYANWAQGERVGHFQHAATLVNLMRKLGNGTCGSADNLTFQSIVSCHTGGNYSGTNLGSLN